MAQSVLDAFGVILDNSVTLNAQALLDSQNEINLASDVVSSNASLPNGTSFIPSNALAEILPTDEDDVFQCGKCKKRFTSLPMFMTHKREHREAAAAAAVAASKAVVTSSAECILSDFDSVDTIENGLNHLDVPASFASHFGNSNVSSISQSIVLNDADILAFNIEHGAFNLPNSVTQVLPTRAFLNEVNKEETKADELNIETSEAQFLTHINGDSVGVISPIPSSVSAANLITSLSNLKDNLNLDSSAQEIELGKQMILQTDVPQLDDSSLIADFPGILIKMDEKDLSESVGEMTEVVSANDIPQLSVPETEEPSDQHTNKKGKKFKCSFCDKAFSKNFDLQQHTRCHTGEKPFQCVVCGRAFSQKSNVKKHMQTHKVWPNGLTKTLPKEPIQTVVAPTTEPEVLEEAEVDTPNPEIDMTDKEGGEKLHVIIDNSYVCQYCNASYKSYFELKAHMKEHTNEKVYKCIQKQCNQTFPELESFLDHMKVHESEVQYRCHICNKFFNSLFDLGVHQYSHSLYPNKSPKNGAREFRCSKCMSRYATPEALKHHLLTSTHNHACPHCNQVFTCERYLRRHLPTHTTVGLYACSICSRTFKTEHYLKVHMLIHSGDKPFQCPECKASFNRKDKLKRHQLIHEPLKKYKCPFRAYLGCPKEFSRPDKLKLHLLTHSAVKPYQCKKCGKSFLRPQRLKEHEKAHQCDNTLMCSVCGLVFKKKQHLAAHRCQGPENADSTSLTCNLCKQVFKKASQLALHQCTQSANIPASCEESDSLKQELPQATSEVPELVKSDLPVIKRKEKLKLKCKSEEEKVMANSVDSEVPTIEIIFMPVSVENSDTFGMDVSSVMPTISLSPQPDSSLDDACVLSLPDDPNYTRKCIELLSYPGEQSYRGKDPTLSVSGARDELHLEFGSSQSLDDSFLASPHRSATPPSEFSMLGVSRPESPAGLLKKDS